MFSKRRLILLFTVIAPLLACGVLLALAYFYLPTYLESKYLPDIVRKAGIEAFRCDVRSVGLTNANIDTLEFGPEAAPDLSIGHMRIDYSLRDLYEKKVKRVTIIGLNIHGRYKNGKLTVVGFDVGALLKGKKTETEQSSSEKEAPTVSSIGEIQINNSSLVFDWTGVPERIPFDLEIIPNKKNNTEFDSILKLYPRGSSIQVVVTFNTEKKIIRLLVNADQIDLNRFFDLFKLTPNLTVSGKIKVDGDVFIRYSPFKFLSSSVLLVGSESKLDYRNLAFRPVQNGDNLAKPVRIDLDQAEQQWEIKISSFRLMSPVACTISELQSSLTVTPKDFRSSANLVLMFGQDTNEKSTNTAFKPFELVNPIRTKVNLMGNVLRTGAWTLTIGNEDVNNSQIGPMNLLLQTQDVALHSNLPKFRVSGAGQNGEGSIDLSLDLPKTTIRSGDSSFELQAFHMAGTSSFDYSTDARGLHSSFELSTPGVKLNSDEMNAVIPKSRFKGTINKNLKNSLSMDGEISFSRAEFQASHLNTVISNVSGRIPLSWPFCGLGGPKGEIKAANIKWNDFNLGPTTAVIQQKGLGFVFSGNHESTLFPGLTVDIYGEGQYEKARYDAEARLAVHSYKMIDPIDLGRFVKTVSELMFAGEVEGDGSLAWSPSKNESSLRFKLSQSNVFDQGGTFSIENIGTDLYFPDIFAVKSSPSQKVYFGNIAVGKMKVDGGQIEYQVESPQSLFIEKASFNWCNGIVNTQAFRITPGEKNYGVVLHCDRLNLAMILEQLGLAKAHGEGTVSGKLPVQYRHGKLSFQNGFLYSSPGEGGTIQLSKTDLLTAGIPFDTPQYTQIQLAAEALKNYEYKWAKLQLNTEGNDLLIRMQFDGKPVHKLPFVYRKELGSFVKIETNEGEGSVFQGISLDVNLNLPIDKILRSKEILKIR